MQRLSDSGGFGCGIDCVDSVAEVKESINGIEVTNMGVIAALVVGMIMGAGAAVIAIVLISEWREDK